jgi:hypothetical protein
MVPNMVPECAFFDHFLNFLIEHSFVQKLLLAKTEAEFVFYWVENIQNHPNKSTES